tara:strand:- start:411 stop:632 length:222 start_codon:yes stop_codon:yes gene_type:complete
MIKSFLKYGTLVGAAFYFGYCKGIESPKRPIAPLTEKTSYLDHTVRELAEKGVDQAKLALEKLIEDFQNGPTR